MGTASAEVQKEDLVEETPAQPTTGVPQPEPEQEEPDVEASVDDLDDEADDEPADEDDESDTGVPAPSGVDWSALGPRLWSALHNILSGNKTKHDDKYVIEASHQAVEEAHDVIAQ